MPFIYDIKKDLRYIEGKEKGITETQFSLISKYIEKTLHLQEPPESIASLFEVPIDFVKQLYKRILDQKNSK